jgi:hypothetical protein
MGEYLVLIPDNCACQYQCRHFSLLGLSIDFIITAKTKFIAELGELQIKSTSAQPFCYLLYLGQVLVDDGYFENFKR